MGHKKQLEISIPSKAICLRLSQEEYKNLQSLSAERGENIQATLKAAVFKKDNLRPIMGKESASKLITEIKRIGNNFNQIAKRLNSGLINGWSDDFDNCSADLSKIRILLNRHVNY